MRICMQVDTYKTQLLNKHGVLGAVIVLLLLGPQSGGKFLSCRISHALELLGAYDEVSPPPQPQDVHCVFFKPFTPSPHLIRKNKFWPGSQISYFLRDILIKFLLKGRFLRRMYGVSRVSIS